MSLIDLLGKILLTSENKNTKMIETSPWGHSAYNVVEEM